MTLPALTPLSHRGSISHASLAPHDIQHAGALIAHRHQQTQHSRPGVGGTAYVAHANAHDRGHLNTTTRAPNARSSLAPLSSRSLSHQSSSTSLLSFSSTSTSKLSQNHHSSASNSSHHLIPAKKQQFHPPLTLSTDVLEQGSTQKRMRGEQVEVFLRRVTHISIVGKAVETMENLYLCKNLTVLYLYDNRITKIAGLEACKGLTRLYLQNNLIETVEGLDCGLDKLTDLHLSGNKISYLGGLHALPSLETLHVDNQKTNSQLQFDVISAEALAFIKSSLKHLTATSNRLSDLTALTALAELQDIDLSHNDIKNWEEVKNLLVCCPELQSININNNPIMHSVLKVRQRAILACQTLECFNEKPIPQVERDFLYNMEIARRRSARSSTAHDQAVHPINLFGGISKYDEKRPIPHLPPYATQYRDLMLHQMASVSKALDNRRVAIRSGIRRAAARAAEVSSSETQAFDDDEEENRIELL